MTEVAFYHLQRLPLEAALPRLLERSLRAGERAVVMAGSADRVAWLDGLLWTYDPASWLPHGSARDGHPEAQPVWLTTEDENPNGARFLFLVDGRASDRMADYARCFDLFDGNDADAVAAARARWKACRAAGFDITYWRQSERGGWERGA